MVRCFRSVAFTPMRNEEDIVSRPILTAEAWVYSIPVSHGYEIKKLNFLTHFGIIKKNSTELWVAKIVK